MELDSGATTSAMWLAATILVAAYALIFSEVIHRTLAAVIGAVAMVGVGMIGGFYSQAGAVAAVDANTMFLLMGMMTLVVLLKPTGGFEYLAIRLAKAAKGSPVLLLVYLSTAVTIVSLFLDNVTTVLVFAPLTVVIARLLGISPVPYLMAEALLSDTGGVATLVGDPPNVMIGSAANINFNTFLFHMGPIILVCWLATLFLLITMFRKDLGNQIDEVLDLGRHPVVLCPSPLPPLPGLRRLDRCRGGAGTGAAGPGRIPEGDRLVGPAVFCRPLRYRGRRGRFRSA